jgi:3-hydroxyisobutyrate dehydrogenase
VARVPADATVGIIGAREAIAALQQCLEAGGVRVHAIEPAPDGGVSRAAVAQLATSCPVIVTVLAAELPLRAVLSACGGAREPGVVVLDLSPLAPSTQRDLMVTSRASNVVLVGGRLLTRIHETTPRTTLYVDDDVIHAEPLRGVLAMLADDTVTTGSAGRAKALGLIDDLLDGVNATIVGEALALGRSAGLDSATLVALLQKGSGATAIMAHPGAFDLATGARCAALARLAGAAQQADHSLLFGSLAIGALLAQSRAARRSAIPRHAAAPARVAS